MAITKELSWTVPADTRALRLDAFVRRCLPHLSLREAQRAIEEGLFWVDGRRGKKGDRLSGGATLSFRGEAQWLAAAPLPRPDLAIVVRYEDEAVLVLDKPAGIATHGFSGRETRSLANFLIAAHPNLGAVGRSPWEPGLVNRLDRDTSGLVLAAKDQTSFDVLRAHSQDGAIQKKYWALVWGTTEDEATISLSLRHDPKDRTKMAPAAKPGSGRQAARSWPATTRFRRRLSAQGFSLLEVEIARGVTHQIRVHLQTAGHPIVGDPLYGADRSDPFSLGRQFLHAWRIEFRHPTDGRTIAVESPLPGDLEEVLGKLGIPA